METSQRHHFAFLKYFIIQTVVLDVILTPVRSHELCVIRN
jgi:hypothetical protein